MLIESGFGRKAENVFVMDGDSPSSAHLVGVCGAGMKALAEILLDATWSLSGSDVQPASSSVQKLIRRGLLFHQGHCASDIPPSVATLVFSQAIPSDNPERMEASRRVMPQLSYAQMVGQLMDRKTGVCVAGTHGKSTTTAMVGRILDSASRLSAVVLGAELCDSHRSGWSGVGDLFVAESCEYQRSFLEFQPKYAVLLGIEPDHFDCYANLDSLQSAFCEFANGVASDGIFLLNGDCAVSRAVASNAATTAKRVQYGVHNAADWSATEIKSVEKGSQFQLCHHGQSVTEIVIRLHGRHNVMNALAAAVLCAEIGIPLETIRDALSSFPGIRRRLEHVGEYRGVTFFDDYAHHPTAVKVTLETLRGLVGKRTIRCVFQPHQVLRTRLLMQEFATSFGAADEVLLAPVFAARESVSDEPFAVSAGLADRIKQHGIPAIAYTSLDQIVGTLDDAWNPGDVIVTMGAGDIDRIHHEFTGRVQTDPSAG